MEESSKGMISKVLASTPGLILLGVTFLLQTMPSTYMPVILKNDFDIPESTSAFIISASTFTYIFACFVSPKLDDYFDPDLVMVVSYFLFLFSGILFAFILSLPSYLLSGVAMTLRAIGGFSAGVYENILSTTLVRRYPDNIGAFSASIEVAINLGSLIGPILGGALYTWSGKFSTACLVPMFLAAVVFIWFVVQVSKELGIRVKRTKFSSSSDDSNTSNGGGGGFLTVISYWQILLLLFLPFYGSFVTNLPLTITAPYIDDAFDKGSVEAGLVFLVDCVGYLVFVMLSGFITDFPRFKILTLWFFAVCPFVMAIGQMLVGPAFFLSLAPSYNWLIVGYSISSSAFGVACGPGLMFVLAMWRGVHADQNSDYTAYITSIFLLTFSLGEGAGNAVGGVLYDYMSYNSIMTVFGLSLIFHGVINTVFVLSARNKIYMKVHVLGAEPTSSSVSSPLLGSKCRNFSGHSESERELYDSTNGERTSM